MFVEDRAKGCDQNERRVESDKEQVGLGRVQFFTVDSGRDTSK